MPRTGYPLFLFLFRSTEGPLVEKRRLFPLPPSLQKPFSGLKGEAISPLAMLAKPHEHNYKFFLFRISHSSTTPQVLQFLGQKRVIRLSSLHLLRIGLSHPR